jgi:hypothetical protein
MPGAAYTQARRALRARLAMLFTVFVIFAAGVNNLNEKAE